MKKYVLAIALIGLSVKGFSQDANKGKSVYSKTCIACHQANGAGIPGAFPPLAQSDYLNKDVNSETDNHSIFTLYKSRSGKNYVSIDNKVSKTDDKGNVSFDTAEIVEYIAISSEFSKILLDK